MGSFVVEILVVLGFCGGMWDKLGQKAIGLRCSVGKRTTRTKNCVKKTQNRNEHDTNTDKTAKLFKTNSAKLSDWLNAKPIKFEHVSMHLQNDE